MKRLLTLTLLILFSFIANAQINNLPSGTSSMTPIGFRGLTLSDSTKLQLYLTYGAPGNSIRMPTYHDILKLSNTYVPYTGATADVNLGTHSLTTTSGITVGTSIWAGGSIGGGDILANMNFFGSALILRPNSSTLHGIHILPATNTGTNDYNIQVRALSGTMALLGDIPTSSNYIQNQNTAAQVGASLWIDGTATIGGKTVFGIGAFAANTAAIYYDSTIGTVQTAKAGTQYEYLLASSNGGTIFSVQAGTTNGSFGSSIRAPGFIKSGGTSLEFLKADGSTDANTYLTTSSAGTLYQPLENQRLSTSSTVYFASVSSFGAAGLAGIGPGTIAVVTPTSSSLQLFGDEIRFTAQTSPQNILHLYQGTSLSPAEFSQTFQQKTGTIALLSDISSATEVDPTVPAYAKALNQYTNTTSDVIFNSVIEGQSNIAGGIPSSLYSIGGATMIARNLSNGYNETNFINAYGAGGSGLAGGFKFTSVNSSGVPTDLLFINGSSKGILTYGVLDIGQVDNTIANDNDFLQLDQTTPGLVVRRTKAQVQTDLSLSSSGIINTPYVTNGSSSGNFTSYMPWRDATYKKVVIYLNGFNSPTSVDWNFPVAFTHTPAYTFSINSGVTLQMGYSTTGVSPFTSGGAITGWVMFEGY